MPKISVVMPVYNGEKYLNQAIDSILAQTFTDFEFIIIDDGSTDNSLAIIKAYQDSRLKLHQNKQNLGLVATLNRGLDLAKCEYIARMDCDDISLPDRFAKQVNFLDNHPHISLVGSSVRIIDGENNLGMVAEMPTSHYLIKWSLQFYCPIMHPTVMYRRESIIQLNGYSSQLILGREKYSGEDYDLWRRLSNTSQLANLPEVLLLLRKHNHNVTKVHFDEHMTNSVIICQSAFQDILEDGLNNIDSTVDRNTVHFIFTREISDPSAKLERFADACNLIYTSYHQFMSKYEINYHDRSRIKEECAKQIISISQQGLPNLKCLQFLMLGIYLAPKYAWAKLGDKRFWMKVISRIRE